MSALHLTTSAQPCVPTIWSSVTDAALSSESRSSDASADPGGDRAAKHARSSAVAESLSPRSVAERRSLPASVRLTGSSSPSNSSTRSPSEVLRPASPSERFQLSRVTGTTEIA